MAYLTQNLTKKKISFFYYLQKTQAILIIKPKAILLFVKDQLYIVRIEYVNTKEFTFTITYENTNSERQKNTMGNHTNVVNMEIEIDAQIEAQNTRNYSKTN